MHCQKQLACELHSAYICKLATVTRRGAAATLDEAEDPKAGIEAAHVGRRGPQSCSLQMPEKLPLTSAR